MRRYFPIHILVLSALATAGEVRPARADGACAG
jgi:hypothetical protein